MVAVNDCFHNLTAMEGVKNGSKRNLTVQINLPFFCIPVRLGNNYRVLCGKINSENVVIRRVICHSIVAQLKFQNLSNQSVMAVKIKLRAYDVAGNEIPGVDDYQYLDLNVRTGECWGADKAIILPEAGTRSFSVEQIGILFSGKSTWEITDFTDSISLPKGVPLEHELTANLLVNTRRCRIFCN